MIDYDNGHLWARLFPKHSHHLLKAFLLFHLCQRSLIWAKGRQGDIQGSCKSELYLRSFSEMLRAVLMRRAHVVDDVMNILHQNKACSPKSHFPERKQASWNNITAYDPTLKKWFANCTKTFSIVLIKFVDIFLLLTSSCCLLGSIRTI